MALGIFDSGVGGLTVYRELAKAFPETDLIYLGDTARVPYGNKSPDTIIRNTLECAKYLIDTYNVSALVTACNTMSSYALEALTLAYNLPVLGVIRAGAENAINITKNGKIGVIGTIATIKSGAYLNALHQMSGDSVSIWQKSCPLLVPLVEEGIIQGEIPRLTIKHYLQEIIDKDVDTLILGCTHYPVLSPLIADIYPDINIVDSAHVLSEYIREMGLAGKENAQREIMVTDASPAFESLKTMLVGNVHMQTISLVPK